MRTTGWLMALVGSLVLVNWPVRLSKVESASARSQATLEDAIEARTDVSVLRDELADSALREIVREGPETKTAQALRKVLARAESKQEQGNILLTKDRYGEAVAAYQEAARLYRQALDWNKVEDTVARAELAVATARLLAEAVAKPEQMKEGHRLQTNAEGYLEAGDLDRALRDFEKARTAFEALIPSQRPATLEEAVAARTAMLAAREQIKGLPRFGARVEPDIAEVRRKLASRAGQPDADRKPKPGSLPDVLTRAQSAESAAAEALEERHYGPSRALFNVAEKLYLEAAVLQAKRDEAQASRDSVQDSLKLADTAFRTDARPASFERGKQALADADKALQDDDIDAAKALLAQAAEEFAAARAEAEQLNALWAAQQAWAAGQSTASAELLAKHALEPWNAAKAGAAKAEASARAGRTQEAAGLYARATEALNEAVATARTRENAATAVPVIQRLESAIAAHNKFAAEDILVELESLIPSDASMPALRERVAALPGPERALTVDLGDGVKMHFVLIRPGSFMMGSDRGDSDEKPIHEVTLTKAFYIGVYEVTQEQWEKVMGSNPSGFKGAKNPVEQVSWQDAQEFARKLSQKEKVTYRLPTEAEWEYACRAGTTTEYYWGEDGQIGDHAWYQGNSGNSTHPVGEKKPNGWGLYDMSGNVWEWCHCYADKYSLERQTDPLGPKSGLNRVDRGGCWSNVAPDCRSANRDWYSPSYRIYVLGFRLVRTIP